MTESSDAILASTPAHSIIDGHARLGAVGHTSRTDTDVSKVVDAVLHGGPVTLPTELRSHRVTSETDKIKIRHLGGYEHFTSDRAGDGGESPVIFRWTGRTRIAE